MGGVTRIGSTAKMSGPTGLPVGPLIFAVDPLLVTLTAAADRPVCSRPVGDNNSEDSENHRCCQLNLPVTKPGVRSGIWPLIDHDKATRCLNPLNPPPKRLTVTQPMLFSSRLPSNPRTSPDANRQAFTDTRCMRRGFGMACVPKRGGVYCAMATFESIRVTWDS